MATDPRRRRALELVRTNPDHYAAQQAAIELTYLVDRPIVEMLADLARHLDQRAADEASAARESGQSTFRVAVVATLAALVLGLTGGIIVIGGDMAERKRTDAALRTAAARLRLESDRHAGSPPRFDGARRPNE